MKKTIKKIISGIAVLSMTAALLPQITFARTESGVYTVYENTFDNGASDLKHASADGYMAQNEFMYFDGILGEMPETATNNGNTGIRIGRGKWMSDRTFLFDFTKGGTTGGVYAGIWTVSFDFAVDTAAEADCLIGGINMSKTYEGGRMFYFYRGGTGGPCPSAGYWGTNDTTKKTFENGVVHNFKTVINLEEGKAEYYLDNVLWHTQTNLSNVIMKNYAISISDLWSYFDNLKITAQFPYTVENEIKTENTGNIFFEDEPVKLNLISTNRLDETATENITMTITDIDGNVVWSDTQAVTMSVLSTAQTQIIPPLDKFGVYNLKVTSDNAKEYTTRLSRSVRADKLNVKSGVAGHFDGRMSMDIPAVFDLMESAGIGNLRTDWGCRTKDDGSVYDYANDGGYFQKTIEEANKRDIDILAILGTTVSGNAANGDFNTSAEALAAYKAYCTSLSQSLAGKVESFELGNENNYQKRRATQQDITDGKTLVYSNGKTLLDTNKVYYNYDSKGNPTTTNRSSDLYDINCTITETTDGDGVTWSYLTVTQKYKFTRTTTTIIENVPAYVFCDGADYYKILQAGYEGIKAGNESTKVATSGSAVVYTDPDGYTNRNQREFANGLLNAAKTNSNYCFDAYAVHPYHISRAPEIADYWIQNTKWSDQGTILNELFNTYSVPSDKLKWATEWGYAGTDSEQKTAWIIRTMLANEIYGCYDKMYLYDFINDGLNASNAEHNYGMICNPQNSTPFNKTAYAAKPQYLATAQFNKMLAGYSFETNEISNDTVYKSKFTDGGDSVYVIWNTSATAADVTVSGAAKTMTVYDMYGNVIAADKNVLTAEKSTTVSAGEEPIYVKFVNHNDAPEDVLYENTFDNGTADLTWIETDCINGGYNTDSIGLSAVTVDGNTGVTASNSGAWTVKQTFFFDFTKGGTQDAPTMGKYKFSFDFRMRETSSANRAGFGINMLKDDDNQTAGNLAMQMGRTLENKGFVGTKNNAESYDVDTNNGTFTYFDIDNNVHTMDIILTLNGTDNARFNYYLDGSKIGCDTRYWGKTLSNMALSLSDQFTYVDNIKLSKLNESGYKYEASADSQYANGYLDITFPAVMNTNDSVFTVDGTAAEAQWLNLHTARVRSDAMTEYGTHTIALDGVKDIFGIAPSNTSLSAELVRYAAAEDVLYFNDFAHGSASVVAADKDAFTLGITTKIVPLTGSVFDGDTGIKPENSDAWPKEHTFLFDFTKGGTQAGISSGKYKISFDFSTANDGGENMYFIVNAVETFYEGGRFATITKDKGFSVFNYVYDWGAADSNKIWPKNDSEKYHCDMILDFAGKVINTYVDGTFLGTTGGLPTMNNFAINMGGQCDYFDNLKLSKLTDEAHQYKFTADAIYANGCADVTFDAAMDTTKGKFTVDGTAAEVQWLSVNKARITSDALNSGGTHTIAVSDAADMFAVAPLNTKVTISTCPYDSLTIENGTVKAVVSNIGDEPKALPVVIVASYEANSLLTNVRICAGFKTGGVAAENLAPGSYAELSADISDMTGTVKAFMWDNLTDMKPLVPAATR